MRHDLLSAEAARALLADSDEIHSGARVREAIDRVAGEIAPRLGDRFPLVLCVMTGGVVFCGELLTRLDFPLSFDYLHATRYHGTAGGALAWRAAPWSPVRERSVLVVDDILDEGVTLAAIRERLVQMGAREVLTAVLVDKDNGKEKPIAADFVALRVPDRFVFGFGMDAHGAGRNVASIRALRKRSE